MRVLSVDPGETVGLAVLDYEEDWPKPQMRASWEKPATPFNEFVKGFLRILPMIQPDVVLLEDYRVYASHAKQHIGAHLLTAELLGAIGALCAIVIPPLKIARLPASKKGRWPIARLNAKFPEALEIKSPHVRDACVLGLVCVEENMGWKP